MIDALMDKPARSARGFVDPDVCIVDMTTTMRREIDQLAVDRELLENRAQMFRQLGHRSPAARIVG
jgi:hypothetical protein